MMFGREIMTPGDWQLQLVEESLNNVNNGPDLSGAHRNPSVETEVSPMEPDDAPVVEEGYPLVSGPKAPSNHIPPE